MATYQNILAAVDGSEESLHAFREALKLADSHSRLSAVSVAPPYEGDLRLVGVNRVKGLMREPCDTALSRSQELAAKAGLSIRTACVIGVPHEGIVEFAEAENCDLIVMGSKGQGFLERLLVGSVTRRVIGFTWQGLPDAKVTTRILWLEGLEPGINRGGNVDSRARYIYIHGTGDETTIGRRISCGCIHLAADDLIPLFDKLPIGTLVWITER